MNSNSSSPMTDGVVLTTLPNGFQLILKEDRSAPVVNVQVWCRAGSIDEGRWLGAGLSHILEHMLFKGTSTRPGARIDQEVQSAGGYMNAYTSFDRTVYWVNVPNTGARVAIDILCDILQNATLPEEELVKELDVIRREMDMGQDDPSRRSGKRLFETAYVRSPYRYPVIGIPDIFNRITRADLLSYYSEKYAPNNCFLVVVGDFQVSEVVDQVTKAFSGTGARAVPPAPVIPEPPQTAPREVVEEAPVELCHFHLAWHIPDVRHEDAPALEVLATLAGHGRSSRLYREVRDRAALVHSVSAWTYSPGHEGLFGVSGTCDGPRLPEARSAILGELERMKTERVGGEELSKALKQFTAGALASRKTMEGQAEDLGSNWMRAHDLGFSERFLEAIRRLTPADLQSVAQRYLTEANRTVYGLVPEGQVPRTVSRPTTVSENPVRLTQLPNGLRLLVKEDHRLPFVEFRLALHGGLLSESESDSGIGTLLCRMLSKGTHQRSADQLAAAIESLGASLEPFAGNHSLGLTGEFLREDFATGLDLFTDVLLNPALRPDALERERAAQLAAIRGQRDQLLKCAFTGMRRGLFGPQGYGLDLAGTETSVNVLNPGVLGAFHRRWITPPNAVLAVYGDLQADAAIEAIQASLGSWSGAAITPDLGGGVGIHQARHLETRDKEQAVIALGYPGTTFDNPDRYALELLQEACSDMGSRLFLRIRDTLGLAYYVGASHFIGRRPGYFAFYCGTAPQHCEQVESELRAQADLLRTGGLTPEELARAKAKVVGQRKIARQDLGHQAMTAALDELYGLGYQNGDTEDARFEQVTLEEIAAVAGRYLVSDRSVVSVVCGQDARAA